jgi:multimeric flavodoxin WrbA
MHNLFILGSPRRDGNSETMAKTVAKGLLQNRENSVEFIHINKLKIRPCQACGGCSTTGNCILKDDMVDLYMKTDSADRLFFVSPVYFYAMTAQIKAYIDRCQAKWSRKYLLKESYRPDDKRTGYLLSCAATNGDKLFDASILTIKSVCDTLDLEYGLPLLIKNLESREALQQHPDQLKACETFGSEIATGKG